MSRTKAEPARCVCVFACLAKAAKRAEPLVTWAAFQARGVQRRVPQIKLGQ